MGFLTISIAIDLNANKIVAIKNIRNMMVIGNRLLSFIIFFILKYDKMPDSVE